MNLILFNSEKDAINEGLKGAHYQHIKKVLKMNVGDELFVGIINGNRGKATLIEDTGTRFLIQVNWNEGFIKPLEVVLIVGLTRPQMSRRILREATTLGVKEIYFFNAEKGESSYGMSRLWQTDEWKRHLIEGAEQAFATTLPEVKHYSGLEEGLEGLDKNFLRLALDNYEAHKHLFDVIQKKEMKDPVVLAIGSERGWSPRERDFLRDQAFALVHLGERVLRTDTACISALSFLSYSVL